MARGFTIDGGKLEAARLAARLTRDELARRVECSYWTVYALETGLRRAGLVLIRALERELGVTARQLGAALPEPGKRPT